MMDFIGRIHGWLRNRLGDVTSGMEPLKGDLHRPFREFAYRRVEVRNIMTYLIKEIKSNRVTLVRLLRERKLAERDTRNRCLVGLVARLQPIRNWKFSRVLWAYHQLRARDFGCLL